jgi:hypothetical protein
MFNYLFYMKTTIENIVSNTDITDKILSIW